MTTLRRLAIAALVVPFVAACAKDETLGTRPTPTGGAMFTNYVALGTSIAAGIQSGGMNDSTQKQAYPYLLAVSMGLTPGVDWHYPKLSMPGCPPPYDNILTAHRIATIPGGCALRDPATTAPFENNLGIPSIRVAQLLNVTRRDFVATDTLGLAQFITGSVNPVDMMAAAHPTFVTLEIGANDVLGAATRGTPTLLTRADSFQAAYDRVVAKIVATGAAGVAVATIPNVTRIPHFTKGSTLFCLATGACGFASVAPFNLPSFTVAANCAPAVAAGVGDKYLLPLTPTATIANVLAGGGAAKLDCANDTAMVNLGAGFGSAGPTINPTEYDTITARVAAFNTYIATVAAANGWALVNLDSALGANAASIPPIPNLSTPLTLMGPLFSQDGVHPNAAGAKIVATAFRNAINLKYGTSLPAIP